MRVVDRIVTFEASLTDVWQALIDAESWPEWMPVRSVDVRPEGRPVDRNSEGIVRWNSGRAMLLHVDEFRPGRSFRWSGRFFGSKVSYDHVATPVNGATEVLFILEVTGPTSRVVGPLLRRAYDAALDDAIPALREKLAG